MTQLTMIPILYHEELEMSNSNPVVEEAQVDHILARLNTALGGNMSTTPGLSKHQLFQSHLVNCAKCQRYPNAKVVQVDNGVYNVETGQKSSYVGKKRHALCPVGVKLLAEALAEDNSKNPFKPTHFPFVPRIHEKVLALNIHTHEWVEGKVMEKSLSATNQPMGYDIEIKEGERFYANRFNVRSLRRHVSKSMDNGGEEREESDSDKTSLQQDNTSGGLRMFRVRGNTPREQTITQSQASPTKGRRFIAK